MFLNWTKQAGNPSFQLVLISTFRSSFKTLRLKFYNLTLQPLINRKCEIVLSMLMVQTGRKVSAVTIIARYEAGILNFFCFCCRQAENKPFSIKHLPKVWLGLENFTFYFHIWYLRIWVCIFLIILKCRLSSYWRKQVRISSKWKYSPTKQFDAEAGNIL